LKPVDNLDVEAAMNQPDDSPQPAPEGMPAEAAGTPPVVQNKTPDDILNAASDAISPVRDSLEKIRGHPVVSYFVDEGAHLTDDQMEVLFEQLHRIGRQKQISLWLYSRGGATTVPVKILSLFRQYADRFAVLVPYRAHSAATHVAMGADEIIMSEMSELGPVDPSRRHPLLPSEDGPNGPRPLMISVQDLRHVLGFLEREIGKDQLTPEAAATIYSALFEKVHPLAIGALEQSWALAGQVSRYALSTHMDLKKDADDIERIAARLGDYYKEHTYPIGRTEARSIGLKVVDASEDEATSMWALYQAYRAFGVGGNVKINDDPATVRRIFHVDSSAGTAVGIAITSTKDPSKSTGQVFARHV
jgi:hypothetical protein